MSTDRLQLPTVTLCAAASVNVNATLSAMDRCLAKVEFADAVLFTNATIADVNPAIRVKCIAPLTSSEAYSSFMLSNLAASIESEHCLVVQWDGFILEPGAWDPEFLKHDYIGAPWPQFAQGWDVGNGGFSLRSHRLLEACASPKFDARHPEDLAICHYNRAMLESFGMRFADRDIAARFAYERDRTAPVSFGFHGVFNLVNEVGADEFWRIYCGLDDPSTAFSDRTSISAAMQTGRNASWRRARFTLDSVLHKLLR